jgi:hypothetical protein
MSDMVIGHYMKTGKALVPVDSELPNSLQSFYRDQVFWHKRKERKFSDQ